MSVGPRTTVRARARILGAAATARPLLSMRLRSSPKTLAMASFISARATLRGDLSRPNALSAVEIARVQLLTLDLMALVDGSECARHLSDVDDRSSILFRALPDQVDDLHRV